MKTVSEINREGGKESDRSRKREGRRQEIERMSEREKEELASTWSKIDIHQ